jgi:hypothetical protein
MKIILIVIIILLYSTTIHSKTKSSLVKPKSYLGLSYGKIALLDNEYKNNNYGIEYIRKKNNKWMLDSLFGISVSNSNNRYVYFGVNRDWKIKGSLVFRSSISVGLFDNNKLIDLGHTVEFQSKFEIAYQFINKHRLGISISHLSNSRLSTKNPGTEAVSFTYTFPLLSK